MEQKALTVINPAEYAVVKSGNVGALLGDVLAPGEEISFSSLPTIKLPAGGGQVWETPSGEPAKELQAIIIHRQPVRALWLEEFSGGGAPPDCSSLDNVHGTGLFGPEQGSIPFVTSSGKEVSNPTGLCAKCPMNQWGSGRENGKACRQITRLFLLFPESVLPTVLVLPPSSFANAQRYITNLVAMGQPYYQVVTSIGLVKAQSKSGIAYSEAVFRKVDDVPAEALPSLAKYREGLVPAITGQPVSAEEV